MKKKKSFNVLSYAFVISIISVAMKLPGLVSTFSLNPAILEGEDGPVLILAFFIKIMFDLVGDFIAWACILGFVKLLIMFSKANKKPVEIGKINGEPIEVDTSVRNVHVSRGGVEDANFRKATGKSLSKEECDDCTDKDPWEKPSFEGIKPKFKLFGGSEGFDDDVENYYKERGSKKKGG